MSETAPYPLLGLSNYEPVDALITLLGENIPEVKFGSDFNMGRVVATDGHEAIRTYLGNADIPAACIYEETHLSERIGIGSFVDAVGRKRAQRIVATLTFDVWARDPKERELTAAVISKFIFDEFWKKLRAIGFNRFEDQVTRTRGFDLTDRILQFHSHQITNIWRRLMFFVVEYERITRSEPDFGTIEQITVALNDTDGLSLGQLQIGSEEIPYLILRRMIRNW